jgi:hypothetical protein
MRITLDMLNKVARDTAAQRSQADLGVLAVYLQGSLLSGDPLLGGAADIDLFIVHNENSPERRELVRMTEDVHIDIAHHPRTLYRQTRELRLDPWMGPTIYWGKILYDPQHFMDFTQASVRGQFNQPDNVIARARLQSNNARQTWFSLQEHPSTAGIEESYLYLQAVKNAANAIASLNGPTLSERRFLLQFPERAEACGNPGLTAGLIGLLGGSELEAETLPSFLPQWEAAFQALSDERRPPKLHLCRLHYYRRAFEAILNGPSPLAALWPLIYTWTTAVRLIPAEASAYASWQKAGELLGLIGPTFEERVRALDIYLDQVEEILDKWAERNGVAT